MSSIRFRRITILTGEHDFGAIELNGERYFFKIDYYDETLSFGSPDAADPTKTTRVLTVRWTSKEKDGAKAAAVAIVRKRSISGARP